MVEPSILTENVERSLQQIWKLNIQGEIFELRPQFNKYTSYSEFQDGTTKMIIPQWEHLTEILHEDFAIKLSAGFLLDFRANRICITKLFYCEQVSLHLEEFRFIPGGVLLVAVNKTVGNAEVIPAINPDGMIREIRICLSDVLEERNGVRHRLNDWLIVVLLLGLLSRMSNQVSLTTF